MNRTLRADLVTRMRTQLKAGRPTPAAIPMRVAHLRNVRAVLFDVYGTLFASASGDINADGAHGNARVMQAAMRAAGVRIRKQRAGARGLELLHEAIQRSHAARRRRGVPHPEVDIRAIWRRVLRELVRENLVTVRDGHVVARLAVEYECRSNPAWPMPGLGALLAALHARGLHLGLVSNAQFYTPLLFEALLRRRLASLGIEPRLCAWSYVLGEAKPSPRLWAEALRRLRERHGIRAAHVLAVGNDMRKDIAPAAHLGCRTAWFVGDARAARPRPPQPPAVMRRPDLVLTALEQLMDALGEQIPPRPAAATRAGTGSTRSNNSAGP